MKKRFIVTVVAMVMAAPAAGMLPWYYYNDTNERGCTQASEIQPGAWWVDGYEADVLTMGWGSSDKQLILDTCVEWAGGGA